MEPEPVDPVPWYEQPLPLLTQAIRFLPVFLLTSIILAIALLVTNERMPDPKEVRPLPDFAFDWFPKIAELEIGTDVCIGVLNATNVVLLFKLYLLHRRYIRQPLLKLPWNIRVITPFMDRVVFRVWDSGWRKFSHHNVHLIAWIRFITTYSCAMLFRAPVIIMTSYPATDNHCQEWVKITNPVKNVILTVVTLGSNSIHCGDLLYSGHTIILSASFMIQWTYGPFLHWSLRIWCTVLLLFAFYCIVASRSHYTDDILVSAYVTMATFLVIRHSQKGAPWQLQMCIRGWPCCGPNKRSFPPDETPTVVTIIDTEIAVEAPRISDENVDVSGEESVGNKPVNDTVGAKNSIVGISPGSLPDYPYSPASSTRQPLSFNASAVASASASLATMVSMASSSCIGGNSNSGIGGSSNSGIGGNSAGSNFERFPFAQSQKGYHANAPATHVPPSSGTGPDCEASTGSPR